MVPAIGYGLRESVGVAAVGDASGENETIRAAIERVRADDGWELGAAAKRLMAHR